MVIEKMSSAMKAKFVTEILSKESVRLNRKKEREKFIPQDMTILLNEKFLKVDPHELPPTSNSEFASVSYMVPLIRQYILSSN